jgi:rhomboid protease GluP
MRRIPVITIMLIGVLVFCFAMETPNRILMSPDTILYKHGVSRAALFNGHILRLLTANLFHMNRGHLISNIIGLIFFSSLIEIILGKPKILVLIIASAMGGTIGSITIDMVRYMVGASTILFGVFGGLGVLIYKYRKLLNRYYLAISIAWVIELIILCTAGYISLKIVDQGAHLGGFIAGIAATCLLTNKKTFSELWETKGKKAEAQL